MVYHLGIDIGASGGRHILGWLFDGKIQTKEIYRFENGIQRENGSLVWDTEKLFKEVLCGIAKAAELGMTPTTVAIDTWGVDYVLLDKAGEVILPVYAYRDSATAQIQDEISAVVSREELYARTGIQYQCFNSVYRLWCDKKQGRLDDAENMLMIPEYLAYRLTGKICREYTNATTTSLVNAKTGDWDYGLIDRLGYPKRLFGKLNKPSTLVGEFSDEIKKALGFNASVVFCPTHDTASAVAACPMDDKGMYISSGTWSLVGAENAYPILTDSARIGNYTNEGGVCGTYRFLKNIMGMWLFQEIRRSTGKIYSYDEMMNMAKDSGFRQTVDPNDGALVSPDDMVDALRGLLGEPDLPLGDVLSCVYHSLAKSYAVAISDIEAICDKEFDTVHIIGGGSKDPYLNELTSLYTGKRVTAGPTEATAIGNLICQMMYTDGALTIQKARDTVKDSFEIKAIESEG